MGEPSIPKGRSNVSLWLANESVMQHCRVQDPDPLDIVIGTNLLRKTPHVKMSHLQTSLCSSLRLRQWPLLRTFGAVRTQGVQAALSSTDKLLYQKVLVDPTHP